MSKKLLLLRCQHDKAALFLLYTGIRSQIRGLLKRTTPATRTGCSRSLEAVPPLLVCHQGLVEDPAETRLLASGARERKTKNRGPATQSTKCPNKKMRPRKSSLYAATDAKTSTHNLHLPHEREAFVPKRTLFFRSFSFETDDGELHSQLYSCRPSVICLFLLFLGAGFVQQSLAEASSRTPVCLCTFSRVL